MMVAVMWSEAMSVGVPALDADHRCLMRIIGLLQDVGEEDASRVVDKVLETLAVYCRYHFAREEHLMREIDFPGIAFHQTEHEGFTAYLVRLRARRSGTDGDAAVARELLEYLTLWLSHHILIQDMAYKPYALRSGAPHEMADIAPPSMARDLHDCLATSHP